MTQFLTSLFAKNIKHATYFKTANQQHQQNPVNELSCTNLYALVCFLRTNICGFFAVHGVYFLYIPKLILLKEEFLNGIDEENSTTLGDRLTDDFEFDAERGFAGDVLEQQSVSAGVGAFYATECQRCGVVYRLYGRPRRRARQLRLTVPPAIQILS